MEEDNKQENSSNNDFLKSKLFLWIIFSIWVIAIIIFNSFIFYYLLNKINTQNSYIIKNSTFCYEKDNNSKDILEKRVENLEQKNIDIFASTQTINFWMTFFAILLPLMLWFFIYQKWKFEDKAEKELDEVKKDKKEALEEISKLRESQEKLKKEFEGALDKYKKEAEENFKQIVKEAEKQRNITNLFEDALKFYKDWNYDSAIKNYDKLIKLDDKNNYWLSAYYCNRGNAYQKIKEYEKAIESYNEAIKINSKDHQFYYNIWNAYYRFKEYEKAIENYDKAIKINPDYKSAIENKSIASEELKEKKLKEKYPEEAPKNS